MATIAAPSLECVSTQRMIEEIEKRDQLAFALQLIRGRIPWWGRFKLGPSVWGLSGRWFAICPWNGDTAWITLAFIYFGIGTKNVELSLGKGKYLVNFDIRWRWD
jgi:hypothetical protein